MLKYGQMENIVKKDIYIYGAGGFGREITKLVADINEQEADKYRIVGYVAAEAPSETLNGLKIISEEAFMDIVAGGGHIAVALAIGTPSAREKIASQLKNYDVEYPTLVHPSSKLNASVTHGEGLLVCAGVIFTADIKIGRHTCINCGCLVGHDVEIGDFVQANPQCCISGDVKIGNKCMLGASSVIHQGIKIESGSTVGIGAVVLRNVKADTVVYGNPARVLPVS